MCRKSQIVLLLLAAVLWLAVPVRASDTVLAECWQGLSSDGALWQECPLGDYAADALRTGTGAEIALIPAELLGNALVGDGEITEADLIEALPEDRPVQVVTLSPAELKELLERGVAGWQLTERETLDPGSGSPDYLQISGLTVRYDASAPPGARVLSMAVSGETLLQTDDVTVSAALPAGMLPEAGTDFADSLRELVRNRLINEGTVELPEGERVRIIGAHQRDLISYVPPGLLLIILVFFLLSSRLSLGRGRTT